MLLILDLIQAYLGGSMDMNRANEARDMTKKLAAPAEKYQCAIVLVGNMKKATVTRRRKAARLQHFHYCKVSKRASRFLGKPHKI